MSKEINLVVLGPLSSGKTSFLKKWTLNTFSETYNPTTNYDFISKYMRMKISSYIELKYMNFLGKIKILNILKLS